MKNGPEDFFHLKAMATMVLPSGLAGKSPMVLCVLSYLNFSVGGTFDTEGIQRNSGQSH